MLPRLVLAVVSATFPAWACELNDVIGSHRPSEEKPQAHGARLSECIAATSDLDAPLPDGETPLVAGLVRNDPAAVRRLLVAGADPTIPGADGREPIDRAVREGRAWAIEMLVGAGAPIDSPNPLFFAILYRDVDAVEALLKVGVDPTAPFIDVFTPMHRAVSQGTAVDARIIGLLIDAGVDPADPTTVPSGDPALHQAAEGRTRLAMRALVAAGADPDQLDEDGRTPMGAAIRTTRIGAPSGFLSVATLLDIGADPNGPEEASSEPLLAALAMGNAPVVDLLLRSGADSNGRGDATGRPLIEAVGTGVPDLVGMLLDAGADPDLTSSDGRTALGALEYVEGAGSDEIRRLLAGDRGR